MLYNLRFDTENFLSGIVAWFCILLSGCLDLQGPLDLSKYTVRPLGIT